MSGFIDLVFEHGGRYYLADYKSNWLGATPEAYGRPCSRGRWGAKRTTCNTSSIASRCTAISASRVPGYRYESHFGGVRYLFVRGMRPAAGRAARRVCRPAAEALIEALDAYLARNAATSS